MNTRWKWALSAALLLTLALACAQGVLAETIISQVDLTCSKNKIDLNTAWTEGEVQSRIRESGTVSISTAGCGLDLGNTSLMYKNGGTWYGIGDGSTKVQVSRQYAVRFNIELKGGYAWYSKIKSLPGGDNPISDCPDFSVYVNGTKRTDVFIRYNAYWDSVAVVVPLPAPVTKGIVTGISIDSNDFTMQRGTSHTFKAAVTGTVTDKSVTWSVSGNKSGKTKITTAGKLTVGSDETAAKITVKAVNKEDTSVSAKVVVTVSKTAVSITGVTVSPAKASVYQGAEKAFTAQVTGTQSDKSVKWTVTGAKSKSTFISDKGVLTVGRDETAATLTVKATASQDKTKSASAAVTVKKSVTLTKVNITYDKTRIALDPKYTERAVSDRVYSCLGVSTKGCEVIAGFMLVRNGNVFSSVDPTAKVNRSRTYYLQVGLRLKPGYFWPETIEALKADAPVLLSGVGGLSVKANGAAKSKIYVIYYAYSNEVHVYLPAEYAIDISAAKVSGFVKSMEYTGKTLKQSVTVKVNGKKLTAGTDYKITYTGNRNAGKATMKITGKGEYFGTLTKKFTIKPVEIVSAKLEYAKIKYTGSALKPKATVKAKVNSKTVTLKAGTDYTITYKNNKAVGTATVTIKGKGNFTGTIVKTFKIVK